MMIKRTAVSSVLPFLWAGAATAQGVMPPVPETHIEILAPTPRTHLLQPRCGPYRDAMTWTFDGKVVRFGAVRLLGKKLNKSDIALLNRSARKLNDDALIRLECNHAGVIVAMFGANSVGSEQESRVDLNYDGDGLRLVGD